MRGLAAMASLPSVGPATPPRHKYRLRFSKAGLLRFISHIDLMHVFERLLRRADLPLATTQGFHPKPRLTFAQALALGVVGLNEVVEIEFTKPFLAEEVLDRLRRNAPPGIDFLSCQAIEHKTAAQVRRAFYRLALPAPIDDLPRRAADLLAQPACWVLRTRPKRRRFDLRPYLSEVGADPQEIQLALWITPNGAARPEEAAHALGVPAGADDGLIVERTHLEIVDELPEADRMLPEIPWMCELSAPADDVIHAEDAASERPRSAPLPTPLVANPLSFET
jgi:radical SAM-linked protein